MKISFPSSRLGRGFSLVELLIVIAVIGVIAAIAVPAMLNASNSAIYAKDRRNAQQIAAQAGNARAAGYSTNWGSVPNAISVLTTNNGAGLNIPLKTGGEVTVGLSGLDGESITNALPYLTNSSTGTPDAIIYLGQ